MVISETLHTSSVYPRLLTCSITSSVQVGRLLVQVDWQKGDPILQVAGKEGATKRLLVTSSNSPPIN